MNCKHCDTEILALECPACSGEYKLPIEITEEEISELIIEFGIEWSIAFAETEPEELAKAIISKLKRDG